MRAGTLARLTDMLGEKAFFPTIGSAVTAYLDTYSVDWDRDGD